MKYGLLFLDTDFDVRKDVPNMNKLPVRCCATCDNWVECTCTNHLGNEVSEGYGGCTINGSLEWDAFSWADDVCSDYTPIEED